MTNRQILTHYATSTIAAIAAWHYIHPAAAILAYVITSAIQTHHSETRQRP